MEDKPRLARLTALITQLQSKRIVTAREMAEKHDVSIRTIYRDLRTLEQSNIPVLTIEGKGYTMMQGYTLPPVMFSEAEANALITAEHLIAKNKDQSFVTDYKNAVEKIKATLKYSHKEKTDLLNERIEIRIHEEINKTSGFLSQIQLALTNFEVINIDYLSLAGARTERRIEPFALVQTQGNWILIAMCQLRKDFRAFRLDCMQRITKTTDHFEAHDLTLAQFYATIKKKQETPDIPLTQPAHKFVSKKNMTMQKLKKEGFQVIGIKVRTTNENGKAAQDIPQLWNRFMTEQIAAKIPNKISEEAYSIYSNYESDHTKPYDTILGCKVSSLEQIPEGMVGHTVEGGSFVKFVSKGDLTQNAVYDTWLEIWGKDLNRNYSSDFECYGAKAMNPKDAEVDILVAVNE